MNFGVSQSGTFQGSILNIFSASVLAFNEIHRRTPGHLHLVFGGIYGNLKSGGRLELAVDPDAVFTESFARIVAGLAGIARPLESAFWTNYLLPRPARSGPALL